MWPIATPSAVAAFSGCAAMFALAIAANSPTVVVLAAAPLIGLAGALALATGAGRRMRRERLEFAWWLDHSTPGTRLGAVVPGVPFLVRCYLRVHGKRGFELARLRPVLPAGVRVLDPEPDSIRLVPRSRTEFAFTFVAPAVGRLVLQGLSVRSPASLGLFQAPMYFPNPLAIKVLPRVSTARSTAVAMVGGLPVERSGQALRQRQSGGAELRELRELQPGDPFKAIAWKASARLGKLMVREVEREVQETAYVVLDVSGSMRGGEVGSRKLDHGVELAAAEVCRSLDRGDRVGLLCVDGRIVSHVPANDGAQQTLRVYDALLTAVDAADADLTQPTLDEVLELVGAYARRQDGLDFARRGAGVWDRAGLVAYAERALRGQPGPAVQAVQTEHEEDSTLRRFCQLRGIALRYRAAPSGTTKAQALSSALRLAAGTLRQPRSILLISDLDGAADQTDLGPTLSLLRAHAHRVCALVPDAVSFAAEARNQRERDLHYVYGLQEARRVRQASKLFGRHGFPAVVTRRGDLPGRIVTRAHQMRRVA
ncbi:MAG: DUF58 domain-containing protein [Proteobacteria bacterium]|nr:DUF58 domain-containing protein [Pseudomonadota bacterium]